jgi:hypothetical protein
MPNTLHGNITIPIANSTNNIIYTGGGGGGGGGGTWSATNAVWNSPAPRVSITDGDIIFDGVSLRDTLKSMQELLAIMVPHPELEKEFEQLKELRNQYNKVAEDCKEKLKAWEILKKSNG